jgi:ribonuclease HI
MLLMLTIYTDGGVQFNGEPHAYGSWCFGAVQLETTSGITWRRHDAGVMQPDAASPVTNNRSELMAAILALEWAFSDFGNIEIELVTDSQITMFCAMQRWKRRANKDLWERYQQAANRHKSIAWRWVKGHKGNIGNEFVDSECTRIMREYAAVLSGKPRCPAVAAVAVSAPRPTALGQASSMAPWEGPEDLAHLRPAAHQAQPEWHPV